MARTGVVLNPHYKGMGNLYGSEYWTYLLPRRCGEAGALALTQSRLPLAANPDLDDRLAAKANACTADDAAKPLAAYRAEELDHMRLNFYRFDPSYHVARWNFITRVPKSRTPLYLARHRAKA